MLTHIPKDIPVFFALAAGLGLATFGFTELNSTARPSSTSALAYVFLPIWSLVFAGLAFAVGVGMRAAWWWFFPETQLRDRASSHQVVVSITALNYITSVHAVPVTLAQHAQPGLAVIMTGRATGGRALLIVLGPDYEVLLEERLVRFWDLESLPLEVRTDLTSGDEAIVVGPGCAESFGLRSRKAVQPSPSRTTPSHP